MPALHKQTHCAFHTHSVCALLPSLRIMKFESLGSRHRKMCEAGSCGSAEFHMHFLRCQFVLELPKTCELFCSVMLFLHCSVTKRLEAAMFDLVARKRTQLCSTLIAWFIALTGQAQQRRVVLRQQSKAFVQVISKWILSKTSADRSCRSGFRSVLCLSNSFYPWGASAI